MARVFPNVGLPHPSEEDQGGGEIEVEIEVESVCVSEGSDNDPSENPGVSREVNSQKMDLEHSLAEHEERFGLNRSTRTGSWRRRISDITVQKMRKARSRQRRASNG